MSAATATVATFYLYQPAGYPTERFAAVSALGALVALVAAALVRLVPRTRSVTPALALAAVVVLFPPTRPDAHLLVDRPSALPTDEIRRYLSAEVSDARLPAMTFGVSERGAPVLVGGFGHGHPSGAAVDGESTFLIGSMSKSFTALVVAQLAQNGTIDLDATADRYLPWFSPRGGPPPTVRSLLDHSSRIPATAGWRLLAGTADPQQSTMDALNDTHLLDEGSVEYNNANYVLLGQVIEATTGSPFADVVHAKVLVPLGLDSTSAEVVVPGRIDGYRMWFGAPILSPIRPQKIAAPAGFMTSNVPDILTYLDAVVGGHRSIPPAVRSLVLDPTSAVPNSSAGEPFANQQYAMGWVRGPISGADVVWHSGGLADFNSVMVADPDGAWSFVVLINTAAQVNDLMPTITANLVAIIEGNQPGTSAGRSLGLRYSLLVPAALAILALLGRETAHLATNRAASAAGTSSLVRGALGVGAVFATIQAAALISGFPASPFRPSDTIALGRLLFTFAPDVAAFFASIIALAATFVIRAVASTVAAVGRLRMLGRAGLELRMELTAKDRHDEILAEWER